MNASDTTSVVEWTSKKVARLNNDITFIRICIKNRGLLKEYHYKKYKSEFWKKVCFEFNLYNKSSAKSCKQLRDKFKYIFKSYKTIGNNIKSTNKKIKELEFKLKEVLDTCFSYIGYDQNGTLSLKSSVSIPKLVHNKRQISFENPNDYEGMDPDELNFMKPMARSSGSLSNLTSESTDTTLLESESILNRPNLMSNMNFDSFPIYQSYRNYIKQKEIPNNPDLVKSAKFIEELHSNHYSLSDIDIFTNFY